MPEERQPNQDEPVEPDRNTLPTPAESGGSNNRGDSDASQGVPQTDETLKKLDRVASLVAFGVLTPAKANAMCGAYHTILTHLDKSHAESSGLTNESVLQSCA